MWQRQVGKQLPLILKVPWSDCPTFTILVMVATGSRFETQQQSGLSHFLEHMFFKGTVKRPSTLAISSELDAIGGSFNAFTSKEYTGYYVKCSAEQSEIAMDVLSDMLINSQFDSQEIEREKGVIIEEINMYQDNPMIHLEDVFERVLYGDTPAGRDTAGSKESVEQFTRNDFIRYWQDYYGQQRTIVCLAGQLPQNIDELVNKYFSDWRPSDSFQDKLAVVEQQVKPQLLVIDKSTDQLHLALGVRSFSYGHEHELAANILAIILGGSMSSRLFLQIRERQGLAYYVRSSTEKYTDTGYLVTTAGIKKEALLVAIQTIIQEYQRLTRELVSDEELNRVKGLISGRLALGLEGSNNLAEWYARQQVIYLAQGRPAEHLKTPEEYLQEVRAITAEQLQAVAQLIFKQQQLNLAIIGQVASQEQLAEQLSFN